MMNDTEFEEALKKAVQVCIDGDYGAALAKSYSYCPHCGAKFGVDHADKRLSALRKMQILESRMHQSGKPDV